MEASKKRPFLKVPRFHPVLLHISPFIPKFEHTHLARLATFQMWQQPMEKRVAVRPGFDWVRGKRFEAVVAGCILINTFSMAFFYRGVSETSVFWSVVFFFFLGGFVLPWRWIVETRR